jgi:glucose/arabinose dehydrogenase
MRYLVFALITACACLLASCSESSDAETTAEPASRPAPAAARQEPAGALPQLKLESVFGSLRFNQMTGMYPAHDGSGRLFVIEQPGRIMAFDPSARSPQAGVYMDIARRVDATGNEMGLLGFAFAPDYARTGAFYLNYTAGNPRRTVISRFRSNQAHTAGDPGSEEVLLEIGQPFVNHNGGQILFGPDGFLYIGMGDGGSARDPMGNGQNPAVLLGKLLRIDVAGAGPDRAYRVPADNPFAGQPGVREEIWATGLRNPWRFSFDPEGGALWLADVGQNTREEINVVTKGGNYGWAVMEGAGCLGGGSNCDSSGFIPPVIDYPTGQNCSVTGGFVYRGKQIEGLSGAYVYGDYCSGRVWGLRYDGANVTEHVEFLDADVRISSFAVDAQGEIYVLAHDNAGGIFKLVPGP